MMWEFVYLKTDLHPASHILPMDINELCASPYRILPSMSVLGSCGNANLHSLVDIILPPFGSLTMIGVFMLIFNRG